MKCVIVAGGRFEPSEAVLKRLFEADLIVCADGGAAHLKALGVTPHVLIGDFDSLSGEDRRFFENQKVPILSFPQKKDRTDSELSLLFALEQKADDITFLGATGTRMDHTLANIMLLERLARQNIKARIMDAQNEIHMVSDKIELEGTPGEILSILPVSAKAAGITLTGLEYPLTDAVLEIGTSCGISNVFKASRVSVSVRSGLLLVIRSKD